MADWNVTLNITEVLEEQLTTNQYISAAFSALSVLPNIFTIFLLLKSRLFQLAEYSFILNWSIFNIFYILSFLYLYVIPNGRLSDNDYSFYYYLSTILIISTSIFVAMLNIEYVLESDKFYKYIIFMVWTFAVLLITGLYLTYFPEVLNITAWFGYLENITFCLLVLLFVLNLFLISLQSGKYKNFKARILLSTVFMLCYGLHWTIGKDIFDDFYSVIAAVASTFLFYLNGLVNFVILVSLDNDVKDYFALKEDQSENGKDNEL